ncbi:MAG: DUF4386 domain-containing protein [Candidatus Dormibacteraeota bacterium]|nr:DUF4386 domain-containing protein [Candidatus Dormibacteraeota bacterium]
MAGGMYLVVAVFGGFAQYTRSSALVAGDPQATAANVSAHATQFQIAFAADLAALPFFLGVGLILYVILRPVNRPIALAMLVINAVSVAIQAINMLNHAAALMVATDPGLTAGLSSTSVQSLVLGLLQMHQVGYLIAQIFFGLYLLPLGYLVYRSGYFPKAIGPILALGSVGYLIGVAISFASPRFDSSVATYFGLVGGLAEMAFLLWLLIKGAAVEAQPDTSLGGALAWKA